MSSSAAAAEASLKEERAAMSEMMARMEGQYLKRLEEREFPRMQEVHSWALEMLRGASVEDRLECMKKADKYRRFYDMCGKKAKERGVSWSQEIDMETKECTLGEGVDFFLWWPGFIDDDILPGLQFLPHLLEYGVESEERYKRVMLLFDKSSRALRKFVCDFRGELARKEATEGDASGKAKGMNAQNGEEKPKKRMGCKRKGDEEKEEGDESHEKPKRRRTKDAKVVDANGGVGEQMEEVVREKKHVNKLDGALKKSSGDAPLKNAMKDFMIAAEYKEYVSKNFNKKGFPRWVSNMKAHPEMDSSTKESLDVSCHTFLAALKKVMDELKSGGYAERALKEKADGWFVQTRSMETSDIHVLDTLEKMTSMMNDEPRVTVKWEGAKVAEKTAKIADKKAVVVEKVKATVAEEAVESEDIDV
jgi:hypothetical protein